MQNNKWFIKIIRALLLGGISSFIYCPECFSNSEENNIRVLLYYISTFFLVFEFISFGVKIINNKYLWRDQKSKLIIANFLLLLVFFPLNFLWVKIIFGSYPDQYSSYQIYFLNLVNFFTAIIILLYENNNYFLKAWRVSLLKVQEIEKQQIKYELQALKNQINPHFLFNNLNTLTHLVHEKNPKAEEYIFQLSNIYRYLLDEKKSHLVAIEKETKMIESLIYLLKIKYSDSIQFKLNLNELKNFKIATFTLQLLVENCVKHNIISEKDILKIELYKKENYLIVKNNVLKKPNYIYTSGIGLENIKNRYKILSKEPVIIEQNSIHFIVKIPIIGYEDTYS